MVVKKKSISELWSQLLNIIGQNDFIKSKTGNNYFENIIVQTQSRRPVDSNVFVAKGKYFHYKSPY